ncbi:MAG: hypothetical protein RBR22_06160 [Desulfuromonas sp.]|nr:hypothetical protein [Desulfuromonas sp.]
MRSIVLVVVALAVLIGGCEQKSEPVVEKAVQVEPAATTSVVEQTKAVVNDAVEQVDAVVDAGKEKLQQAGVAAEQAVQEVKETAAKDLAAGAVVAQEKVTQAVATVQQQASAVQQDGGNLLNTLVDKAVDSAAPVTDSASATTSEAVPAGQALLSNVVAAATEVAATDNTAVEILVIKNTKGDVTLKHAQHGEKYGCAVCHGEGVPAAFELGKTRAHKLCKDCHKQNNGPVSCSGCHVK